MSELHLYPMFVFSSFGYSGSLSMDALPTPAFSNNSSACLQSPFMLQATAMGKVHGCHSSPLPTPAMRRPHPSRTSTGHWHS